MHVLHTHTHTNTHTHTHACRAMPTPPYLLPAAAVDVDRVARELDVSALQENVFNVAFCNLEAEVGELPPLIPNAHMR